MVRRQIAVDAHLQKTTTKVVAKLLLITSHVSSISQGSFAFPPSTVKSTFNIMKFTFMLPTEWIKCGSSTRQNSMFTLCKTWRVTCVDY